MSYVSVLLLQRVLEAIRTSLKLALKPKEVVDQLDKVTPSVLQICVRCTYRFFLKYWSTLLDSQMQRKQ
jgi:hypothetical protein